MPTLRITNKPLAMARNGEIMTMGLDARGNQAKIALESQIRISTPRKQICLRTKTDKQHKNDAKGSFMNHSTSTITHSNTTPSTQDLLELAKTNDADAQFRLGMILLCENRVGFAKIFLQNAANHGNTRARKYSDILKNNERTISKWRQVIIDLEAKFIGSMKI